MAEPRSTNDSNTYLNKAFSTTSSYPLPASTLFVVALNQPQPPVMVALARVFTSSHSEQSS